MHTVELSQFRYAAGCVQIVNVSNAEMSPA
jgi:hypothetical protein